MDSVNTGNNLVFNWMYVKGQATLKFPRASLLGALGSEVQVTKRNSWGVFSSASPSAARFLFPPLSLLK